MQLEYLVSQFQKKDEKAFEKLYNMCKVMWLSFPIEIRISLPEGMIES